VGDNNGADCCGRKKEKIDLLRETFLEKKQIIKNKKTMTVCL